MKTKFEKREANQDFDHTAEAVEMFESLGFVKPKVQTCLTNGVSHYAHVELEVLQPGKLPMDMFVFEGFASVKVRISDHTSNLERFGGAVANQVSFQYLKVAIEKGIVKPA